MGDRNTNANKGVILLVDDTPSDVRPLSDFLTGQGFDVRFASSGRAAIQAAGYDPPDIILLDVMMPEMDGYEVCERLKANKHLKNIPVLLIGMSDEPMDKTKGFDVGGVDHITKPFEFVEVLARVETHLNSARMKVQLELATRELDAARKASEQLYGNLEGQVRRRTSELEDANKALRDIKAQFEAVYNHHYQLTGLIDKEGRLLMGNRTALELAGVEAQDVVGKFFWETPWWTHSQEAQRMLREAMERAMKGEMVQFDTTHTSTTGETRNIDFRIEPVFEDDGEMIYLVPEGYDITERKQAEEALRESEERYRSFVQNFQGIAFRGKMNFTPIFFHGAVEEITGYTEAEFIAEKPRWDQVIHSDDLSTVFTEDEKKLNLVPGYSCEREYRIVCKDGQIRWIHEVIRNICDDAGQPALLQGAIYDITERKLAEKALQESEEVYRTLVESANSIILKWDTNGHIIYLNPYGLEYF